MKALNSKSRFELSYEKNDSKIILHSPRKLGWKTTLGHLKPRYRSRDTLFPSPSTIAMRRLVGKLGENATKLRFSVDVSPECRLRARKARAKRGKMVESDGKRGKGRSRGGRLSAARARNGFEISERGTISGLASWLIPTSTFQLFPSLVRLFQPSRSFCTESLVRFRMQSFLLATIPALLPFMSDPHTEIRSGTHRHTCIGVSCVIMGLHTDLPRVQNP